MDNSIQSFLHGGQRLSADLLLHCLQQLKLVFGNKGFLSNEDVAQTVTAVASDLPFNDLQVYISLLCDSLPLGENYSALFEFLEDSQRFLMSISNTLYNYSEGYNYPAIRYFQEDVYAMFPAQQSQNYQSNSSYYNDYGSNQSVGSHHSNHMNNGHRYQQQGMNPGHRGNFQRRQMYNQHMPQHDPNMRHFKNKNGSNEDFGKALQRIALEKQPSICRLQALLRKNGMEIIFPQAIHDTVSYAIITSSFSLIYHFVFILGASMCLCGYASSSEDFSSSIVAHDFDGTTNIPRFNRYSAPVEVENPWNCILVKVQSAVGHC